MECNDWAGVWSVMIGISMEGKYWDKYYVSIRVSIGLEYGV
jgi:hypothetical protein